MGSADKAASVTTTAPYEAVTTTYTLPMPTEPGLLGAIDYNKVAVIAMVLNDKGQTLNAAKTYLNADETTGIAAVGTPSATAVGEVARYTVDGRRLSAPQPGLNIVRLSDGTTVKVMVK